MFPINSLQIQSCVSSSLEQFTMWGFRPKMYEAAWVAINENFPRMTQRFGFFIFFLSLSPFSVDEHHGAVESDDPAVLSES